MPCCSNVASQASEAGRIFAPTAPGHSPPHSSPVKPIMKIRLIPLCTFLCLLALASPVTAQNTAKGLKALEDKNYTEAQKIFREALIMDENDVAGNYGMSRIYSAAASGMKDPEKALEHLLVAEEAWKNADSKVQAKLADMGVSKTAIAEQRTNLERAFLEEAKKAGTVEALDAFLNRFPDSGVNGAARNNRNAIAFQKAQALNSLEGWNDFVTKYPDAEEINLAKENRNRLATEVALATNSVAGYKEFLQKYHDAPQVPQIQQRLNAVAFEETKKVNTIEAWEAYIRNYPESIFLQKAKEQLNYLRAGVADE